VKRAPLTILIALVLSYVSTDFGNSQGGGQIDGTRFASISVRASASVGLADRRVARTMFWQQVGLLSDDERQATTAGLVMLLSSGDAKSRLESAEMLIASKQYWSTKNMSIDTASVYQLMLGTQDITLRNGLDGALANARGLYRDGIDGYNSDNLAEVTPAGDKLNAMANNFPKSRYAENASFYVGQYFTKLYLLNDPRGKSLIDSSNAALENYISKAEKGTFVKTDFLAAGYFYRALNALIVGNIRDAQNWLTRGAQRSTDKDRVYVFQLYYSPDTSNTIADKFYPAPAIFANTLAYLQQNPNTGPNQQKALLAAISQSGQ
jgi:hypothetical protein